MKTINWKTVIPYGVIIILLFFGFFYVKKVHNLEKELSSEVKFRTALIDTVDRYMNKEKEYVAEKLSLQTTIKTLNKINDDLSMSQKDLLKRVKEIEKNSTIIAAALIKTNAKIDSLRQGNVDIDSAGNKINFSDSTKDIQYNIEIGNVKPFDKLIKPTLTFKEFNLPNTQFMEFHWKGKKEGYPVSFSISNSNPYFKTSNVDSYIIPEIDKPVIKPTWWGKNVGKLKQGGTILISVGIGAAIVLLLK